MAFSFALSQVFSRKLRDLDISLTNAFIGLFGFVILLIISFFIEGDTISTIKSISLNSWILISYQSIVVSLGAHLMKFLLYCSFWVV
jgi:O-acetylserine/cysteine efflux transporter